MRAPLMVCLEHGGRHQEAKTNVWLYTYKLPAGAWWLTDLVFTFGLPDDATVGLLVGGFARWGAIPAQLFGHHAVRPKFRECIGDGSRVDVVLTIPEKIFLQPEQRERGCSAELVLVGEIEVEP